MNWKHLFRPRWQHPDIEIRLRAISKLKNTDILVQIAMDINDSVGARCAAIRNIHIQEVLTKLALEDKHSFIREEAVQNITSQETITRIALYDKELRVRVNAIKKLKDQVLLRKIIQNDKEISYLKIAAIGQLRFVFQENLLFDLIKGSSDYEIKNACLRKLIEYNYFTEEYIVEEALKSAHLCTILIVLPIVNNPDYVLILAIKILKVEWSEIREEEEAIVILNKKLQSDPHLAVYENQLNAIIKKIEEKIAYRRMLRQRPGYWVTTKGGTKHI